MTKLRIIFMGTPDFALTALISLYNAGHDIVAVYCQPPKEKGRGYKVQKNPTHLWAEENGIPVYTPISFKTSDEVDFFKTHNADIAVVAAYGMILPKEILEVPSMGCINIHGSLLPRWRGAAPIHRALMAGDGFTGITTMIMDEGLDTGHMLEWSEIPITMESNLQQLHDDLAELGSKLILSTLRGLLNKTLMPTPQPELGITYAHKLQKEEGLLNFSKPAIDLFRAIRALVPQVSVWSTLGEMRVKILDVALKTTEFNVDPGVIVHQNGQLYIQCGNGSLQILRIQAEGGKPMNTQDFLRGLR